MSIVFLGDVATDMSVNADVCFDNELVIANLEGAIVSQDLLSRRVVYNSVSVIDFLKKTGVNAVGLANNHIYDVADDLQETKEVLRRSGLSYFGAGKNLDSASKPFVHQLGNQTVVVLGAGWPVIGCQPASRTANGVCPIEPGLLFDMLELAIESHDNAKVFFFLHWNYELELYPQPAHRQLAFELVNRGAAAVVGAHSHCVQGIERVGEGIVVHGLGNWMFPHNRFFNGKLAFPEFATEQIACEIDWENSNHKIHWCQFQDDNRIVKNGESGLESERIAELTPYAGMSHRDYVRWFKIHRRKKKLLPVYADYRHKLRNRAKDKFVRMRQFGLDKLVEFGLKGAPR